MKSLKKILPGITLCMIMSASFGQEAVSVLNYDVVKKRLEKSDAAIENSKKNVNPKTWFQRGSILQDVADVGIDQISLGLDKLVIQVNYGTPEKIETRENKEVLFYPDAKIFLEDGVVTGWEQPRLITEQPLKKALDAYDKTVELDVDGKMSKKLLTNLQRIKAQLQVKAIITYNEENYEGAFYYVDQYIRAGEFDVFEGAVDTMYYYFAAVYSKEAGDYEKSIEYYYKTIELGYGGQTPYVELKQILIEQGDSAQALEVLQNGFKSLENNSAIVPELVNFYISADKAEEALKYLSIAKEVEPNNKSYYFAEGVLQDKTGNKEKSMDAYLKAIEIDPEYFEAYFNLSVLYYNQAVELFDQASKTKDNKKYEELKNKAEDKLKEALPYMEKAHNINPEDIEAIETLKNLYYRSKMTDKYDEMQTKLKALKGE